MPFSTPVFKVPYSIPLFASFLVRLHVHRHLVCKIPLSSSVFLSFSLVATVINGLMLQKQLYLPLSRYFGCIFHFSRDPSPIEPQPMPWTVNIQRFCSGYCIESSDACNNINADTSYSRPAELLVSLSVALLNMVAEAVRKEQLSEPVFLRIHFVSYGRKQL